MAGGNCRFENPSSWLQKFRLKRPAVSCTDAAEAKNIPLEHELKSLLLSSSRGLLLVHLRGDKRVSLRKVKNVLGADEARLAEPSVLARLGISPGTLHPFHPAMWTGLHLLASPVTQLPWVSTNAGRPDEYVVFDPMILTRATNLSVCEIEE
jgi:prolyl-tRNA editing enzyme YbaK/EbsC (Cys-tRNA(Pro) deacylase)